VVKQKSHCEEFFGIGQGNPNLQWDCKQGFFKKNFFLKYQKFGKLFPKNSQTYTRKNKSFHFSSFG
jgi:hypothetical protein